MLPLGPMFLPCRPLGEKEKGQRFGVGRGERGKEKSGQGFPASGRKKGERKGIGLNRQRKKGGGEKRKPLLLPKDGERGGGATSQEERENLWGRREENELTIFIPERGKRKERGDSICLLNKNHGFLFLASGKEGGKKKKGECYFFSRSCWHF